MLRTFVTVAVIWMAGAFVASIHPVPWAWWGIMAAIGCAIITIHPAGRIQAIIGGTFLATLVVHGAYGLSVEMVRNISTEIYLKSLNTLNILRVSLCAGWLGVASAKMAYARFLAYRGAAVARPYHSNMG